MAKGNEELMHECFPKRSGIGTSRIKYNEVPEEGGKKREVSMERRKAGTKEKRSRDGLNYPNQNTIIIKKHDL